MTDVLKPVAPIARESVEDRVAWPMQMIDSAQLIYQRDGCQHVGQAIHEKLRVLETLSVARGEARALVE